MQIKSSSGRHYAEFEKNFSNCFQLIARKKVSGPEIQDGHYSQIIRGTNLKTDH